jgi:hypothetical protein
MFLFGLFIVTMRHGYAICMQRGKKNNHSLVDLVAPNVPRLKQLSAADTYPCFDLTQFPSMVPIPFLGVLLGVSPTPLFRSFSLGSQQKQNEERKSTFHVRVGSLSSLFPTS